MPSSGDDRIAPVLSPSHHRTFGSSHPAVDPSSIDTVLKVNFKSRNWIGKVGEFSRRYLPTFLNFPASHSFRYKYEQEITFLFR
jgi:hypothetical protein